jgi:hypothetical protein
VEIIKHEQGHFDAENILFLDLNSRSKRNDSIDILIKYYLNRSDGCE